MKRLSVTRKGWTSGNRRRSFVKPNQLKAWVEAVQGLDGLHLAAEARDCLMLGLLTGVRPSEARGLRWADVDFANATLTFRDTKNGTDHELPLTRWLAEMLARAEASPAASWCSATRPEPAQGRAAAVERIAERTGAFMPSDLRRTFVTTAERLDIGPYTLKRMLNHAIGGDVTSGYIVPTTDRLREPMQRVEDWISRPPGCDPPPTCRDAGRAVSRLFDICAEATGVRPSDLPLGDPRRDKATWLVSRLRSAGSPAWDDPARTRDEIEGMIEDIRRLKARIGRLDGYSLSQARTSAPDVVAAFARFNAALATGEDLERAAEEDIWRCERARANSGPTSLGSRHLDSLEGAGGGCPECPRNGCMATQRRRGP